MGSSTTAAPSVLDFDEGEEPTPADVAVQVWLKDRDLLESKHAERFLVRSKTFIFYPGSAQTRQQPELTEVVRISIQDDLDVWFDKKRRGKGCRVFAFPRGNEVWFLIRHGEPFRREGTFDDGEASSVYYRPEKFDVLIYYCDLGGMAVHATTKGEKDLYQRAFGKHFFGNAGYFGPGGNYTLLPLLEEGTGSLNCVDIEGLDWVRLKEVEVFCGNGLTVIYKAPDLFSKLGTGAEAALRSGFLTRAGFTVKFADSRTARSVSVPSTPAPAMGSLAAIATSARSRSSAAIRKGRARRASWCGSCSSCEKRTCCPRLSACRPVP